jgi:hypothetical protein
MQKSDFRFKTMKKYCILIILIIFSGCIFYTGQEDWDYYTPCNFNPKNLEELECFCYNSIKSANDYDIYGIMEYFGTPKEVLANMQGDCDCRASLFAYIAYRQLGYDVIIKRVQGDNTQHIIVEANGRDWLVSISQGWPVIDTYNFGQYMWICENTHGNIQH